MPSANNVEQTELTRQGLQGSQKEILSKHLLHCLDTLWLTQPVQQLKVFFNSSFTIFFLGVGGLRNFYILYIVCVAVAFAAFWG